MCQPSPLGRCSTDARKASETAELKLRDASRQEREARSELRTSHAECLKLTSEAVGKPSTAEENKALKKAQDKLKKSIVSWDATKEKKAKAQDDVDIKRMHFDTTPAGQKELLPNSDAEDYNARLEIALEVSSWQDRVKRTTDNNGNPITSKEGKLSPESYKEFLSLHLEASEKLKSSTISFNVANATAIAEQKKSREYEETNPRLVESQDDKAFKAATRAQRYRLQALMYQDRVNDLSKILRNHPAAH